MYSWINVVSEFLLHCFFALLSVDVTHERDHTHAEYAHVRNLALAEHPPFTNPGYAAATHSVRKSEGLAHLTTLFRMYTGLQMTRLSFNAALVERSAVAKSLVEVRVWFGGM